MKTQKQVQTMKRTSRNVRLRSVIAVAEPGGMVHIGNNIYIPIDALTGYMKSKFGSDNIVSQNGQIVLTMDLRLTVCDVDTYQPSPPQAQGDSEFGYGQDGQEI